MATYGVSRRQMSRDWVVPLTGAVRRSQDAVGRLVLLTLTLPIRLTIKPESSGPLLYRQQRVGLSGKLCDLVKLRSMRNDAEVDGRQWAAEHDTRVTRIGGFIRAFRIDELPQLLNVLRGEMSFVGPCPEQPCFVEQLRQVIPHYDERTLVLPGITGWSKVNYPYGALMEDARFKLKFDLHYAHNQTLRIDLRILLTTVWVVMFRSAAR